MDQPSAELLTKLLKEVSRSFYLTLRVLPDAVRPQISLAYLLARTSDTLADTDILPAANRLKGLAAYAARVAGERARPVEFPEFITNQGVPAEAELLRRSEEAVGLLETFEEMDRHLIRKVLKVIISGQTLDLQRFAGASERRVVALETETELDDYTYRVAGVVGEFWTELCRDHLFPRARIDGAAMIEKGIRFGKGLQLVNILRDIPKDLRQGRCYIPRDLLRQADLQPADLLEPGTEYRFRPVHRHLLNRAENFLGDAWAYTNAIPRGQLRVRLACAWPVLIGLETVKALRSGNVLDPAQRIKVSRDRVKFLMARSIVAYPFPGFWNRQVQV